MENTVSPETAATWVTRCGVPEATPGNSVQPMDCRRWDTTDTFGFPEPTTPITPISTVADIGIPECSISTAPVASDWALGVAKWAALIGSKSVTICRTIGTPESSIISITPVTSSRCFGVAKWTTLTGPKSVAIGRTIGTSPGVTVLIGSRWGQYPKPSRCSKPRKQFVIEQFGRSELIWW